MTQFVDDPGRKTGHGFAALFSKLRLLAIVLLLSSISAGLWWLGYQPSLALPDGCRLKLLGAKYGNRVHFEFTDELWGRISRLVFPEGWLGRHKVFNSKHFNVGLGNRRGKALAVLLELVGSHAAKKKALEDLGKIRYRIRSRGGFAYERSPPIESLHLDESDYVVLRFTAFPREAKRLGLEVLWSTETGWKRLGRLRFTNPARGPARKRPAWRTGGYPIRGQTNGIDFEVGPVVVKPRAWEDRGVLDWTASLPLRIDREEGNPRRWTPERVTVQEPSGNTRVYEPEVEASNGWWICRLSPSLDPKKPWKVRVRLRRKGGFSRSDLLKIRLPAHGAATWETNFSNAHLTIESFNNACRVVWKDPSATRDLAFIAPSNIVPHRVDSKEGEAMFLSLPHSLSPGGVSLTFAVERSADLIFFVRPRREP